MFRCLLPLLAFVCCGSLVAQDFPAVTEVCRYGAFSLQSPLTDGVNYAYQWERSFDGGASWSPTGTDAPSLHIPSPNSGVSYRLFYATDTSCLALASCRSVTSATTLMVSIPTFAQGRSICHGDTLFVGATALTSYGNHETVLQTADGNCDSLVRTFLQVLPAYDDRFFIDLCPGDSFRGQVFTADTIIQEFLVASSGCDSTVAYAISIAFPSQPTITGPDQICAGETASLEVAGAFSRYAWSTGNDGDDASVTTPGTYTLTLTDFNGCTLELSHQLSVTELSLEAPTTTQPACPGGSSGAVSVFATGDSDLLYSIDGGESFQPDSLFSGLSAGAYDLVVENIDGCQATGSVVLDDAPQLRISGNLPEELTIERGDSVFASFTSDFAVEEWRWNGQAFASCNDCPDPVLTPFVTTRFIIEAVAAGGCSVQDSVRVNVLDSRRFYAPTAFSPNGDDRNDVWRLFTGPRVEAVTGLQIADRWGGIRYRQIADLPPDEAAWDGNQQNDGQPLPAGTYVWSAGLLFTDGSSRAVRGQITLMR
ncbi:T9SS type B sorting domain-containing protein [Neolewinella aurantiaca]|uniref:T9SS type B sorting domain-containing protein n=1 Tax=Neolewinella aurantiaca TaxID=2602767 RepID=A0A5C7FP68_9BACT|nr:T9SS type B sorting domain-containing protein [Neolewinella aurantiaca]TXF88221.1 T9SS type B sorting domain-containing protein [Neolewinella aurantiaca]